MSQKELIENLNEILNQKDTVLIPENIKSGINILGVEGSLDILNTSDATASAENIISGKTAYVNGQKITGSIPTNGNLYYTPNTQDQEIPAGYTEGGTVWGDLNLKPENIKKDVEIFNIIGNYEDRLDTSDATAVASQILLGQTAYVNDVKITGTMPYRGSKIITPSSVPQIFPSGYYSDLQIITDSNLIPENIKSGITIFDVEGTMDPGLDTSDATASSKFIVEGYTAYVNGAKITGGLKSSGNVNYTNNNFISKYSNTAMNFFHQYTEDIAQWRDTRINLIINNTDIASAIELTAEKILKGNIILGIAGTGGLDTSDANLTADLMPVNRTAYVKGEKLTGTLPLWYNFGYIPKTIAYEPFSSTDTTIYLTFTATTTSKFITHPDMDMTIKFRISDETKLAEVVGLTSDKLLEGNTVLGIAGTAQKAGNWIQAPDLTEDGVERYFATNPNAYARRAGVDDAAHLILEPKTIYCKGTMSTINGFVYNTSETDISEAITVKLNIEYANGTSMKIGGVLNKVSAGSYVSFEANATANLINYRDGIVGLYLSLS